MHDESQTSLPEDDGLGGRRAEGRGPGLLVGLALGLLVATFAFLDPLSWHSLDETLRAGGSTQPGASSSAEDSQLWTCSMHPQVLEQEPGQCPICHMDLTPALGGQAHQAETTEHEHAHAGSDDKSGVWTCPMHPNIVRHEPGSCPICGMDLVHKAAEGSSSDQAAEAPDTHGTAEVGAITVDGNMLQAMNVRTERVQRRQLEPAIRTVGYLEMDPERINTVTTRVTGWIEKVHVHNLGESVRPGQPLFEVYAPELVQTQEELLSARRFAAELEEADAATRQRAEALVEAARTRLRYWDVSEAALERLEQSGQVQRTVTVLAASRGVIIERPEGLQGMAVRPGLVVLRIVDLRHLWLTVELFQDQVHRVREGTPARISLTYQPDKTYRGTLRYFEPELDPRTRALKAKVSVSNPRGELKAGMFAEVRLEPEAAPPVLVVPSQAVLREGDRRLAVVALGDGRFIPRLLQLGKQSEGWVEVIEGLEEGERIVSSSQFLLDSEANLQAAIRRMMAERGTDGDGSSQSEASTSQSETHAGHHH